MPSAEPMAVAALSGWTSEQMAAARERGGKPLYSADAVGPAPIQDAEAPGAGRGRPHFRRPTVPNATRAGDSANNAGSNKVGRPHSNGE